jgi:hypothetical protein
MHLDFHIPDCDEFRNGYQVFNERENPGVGRIWFDAASIVSNDWGDPIRIAEGVERIIRGWNRFYANFDFDSLVNCIENNLNTLEIFRNRDIKTLSETDTHQIEILFNFFLEALKRRSDSRKSAVSVAKALSVLAPEFFPLWDSNIASAYDCWYFADTAAPRYILFCKKMKLFAERVAICVPSPDDRPLLKRIDEYNIARYTAHWL